MATQADIEGIEEAIKGIDRKLMKLRRIVHKSRKLEKKLHFLGIQRSLEHDRAELRRRLFDRLG